MKKLLIAFLFLLIPAVGWGALQSDNFDDNSTGAFWSKIEANGGVATEANGKLECAVTTTEDFAGYVTASSHDLTTADFTVDVNNDSIIVAIESQVSIA